MGLKGSGLQAGEAAILAVETQLFGSLQGFVMTLTGHRVLGGKLICSRTRSIQGQIVWSHHT